MFFFKNYLHETKIQIMIMLDMICMLYGERW